jgi:hypothetical protein
MKFIKKVIGSVYGPEHYQELIEQPFSYSVKYFVRFSAILGLLFIIGFSIFYFPKMKAVLNDGVRIVADSYPQELIVTIKGGNISTNVEDPYYIKLPASIDKNNNQAGKYENLITIDTKSEASVDNLLKHKTAILITKSYIVNRKSNGQIVIQSLEKVADIVIDKASVASFLEKLSPYLKLMYLFFVVVFFVFFVVFILFRLCYLFLAALFIWLIANIKNVKISYGKSYQLGLHLMTLPLIVVYPFGFIKFPLAFSLLLMVLAFVNIKKKEVEVEVAQPEAIQESEVKEA